MFKKLGMLRPEKSGLNIIIVGCGKVGSTITAQLYNEGHNITLIDKNAAAIEALTGSYDVMGIVGNGASYSVQMEAGIEKADLIIAVTDSDELNLLCCTVARRVGHCDAVARVRTPDYSEEIGYLREKLGLTLILNPEREAANEIARILYLPIALGVSPFARGEAELVRFKLPPENLLCGQKLMELGHLTSRRVLVCAVERGDEVFIPDGRFVFRAGDTVSFISASKTAPGFFESIGMRTHKVKNTLIIGGGRAAFYLARELLSMGIGVKIIEKDPERCKALEDLLPAAVVICGDGTDQDLLIEEGLERVESFVPLTGLDEENILLTLFARDASRAKVITKLGRVGFKGVIAKLELGSVVYPKFITSEAIIAYVRARKNSVGSDIETLYHMFDNRVEAIEFKVAGRIEGVTDIPLRDLPTKENLLIACISRAGRSIIPGGSDAIRTGDSVVIVTTHTGFHDLRDILR